MEARGPGDRPLPAGLGGLPAPRAESPSLPFKTGHATLAANGTDALYQTIIRDHYRRPRNRGEMEAATGSGTAHNRFCGDTVVMWAEVEDGRLTKVTFDGRGCAISQAAASILTVVTKGMRVDDIAELRRSFVDGLAPDGPPLPRTLGDLRALVGVRRFPSRVRCAVLAFEALEDAVPRAAAEAGAKDVGTSDVEAPEIGAPEGGATEAGAPKAVPAGVAFSKAVPATGS